MGGIGHLVWRAPEKGLIERGFSSLSEASVSSSRVVSRLSSAVSSRNSPNNSGIHKIAAYFSHVIDVQDQYVVVWSSGPRFHYLLVSWGWLLSQGGSGHSSQQERRDGHGHIGAF